MQPKRFCRYGIVSERTIAMLRVLLPIIALVLVALESSCAYRPKAQVEAAQGQITKGPCLLRVCQDRVALMWETETKGPCQVCYGERDSLDTCAESVEGEITYGTGLLSLMQKTAYIHKACIKDLKPGRMYAYRIVGPDLRSKVYEFRTVPRSTDEVRFIVYGDSRTQVNIHRRLVEQMMKHDVAFIVNGGDLVSRGDDYQQWGPQFFAPLKGLMERVPIYIAKGNHEGSNGTYEKLLVPPGAGNDFGLDYGPLHYFCADNVSRGVDHERLVAHIAEDAGASAARWKFVSYHVPSVNFGGHWSNWRQAEALPAFADAGIDFVITGHSHQYERFRPAEPAGQGHCVTYITAGGGGAPLYPVEPSAHHAYAQAIYHFCLFHIKGDRLTMDTIDAEGQVIDHLEITKRGSRLDRQYLSTAVPMGSLQLHRLLYDSLAVALPNKPQKGQPGTLRVALDVPPAAGGARLTFEVRGDAEGYRLPESQTVTIPDQGGTAHVDLTVTPKAAVRLGRAGRDRTASVEPALWLDCHYELGRFEETISRPVLVKSE
jgi:predicted phosphodiesterase